MQVYREDTPETQKNKPLEQIIPLLHLPQNSTKILLFVYHDIITTTGRNYSCRKKKTCQDLTAYLIFHLVGALEALEKHQS